MLLASEIAEEYPVTGVRVETPNGFVDVKTVYKTKPLDTWKLTTVHGKELIGSRHHLVHTEIALQELHTIQPGDFVFTNTGCEEVLSIGPTGKTEELYDLSIDSSDHLFYSGGVLSHNSTTFAVNQLIMSYLLPKFSTLYVAPYAQQKSTYAQKLGEMEKAFAFPIGPQNVNKKVFPNGSLIELVHCLTTASHARGKSTDQILVDEAQNMDGSIVYEILQSMSASDISAKIFAGTALTTESFLEAKWQQSSMASWKIKCNCGKWIDTYDAKLLFKMCVNPEGPVCPYCEKLVDVTNGYYTHENMGLFERGLIGFHIPQIIIPDKVYTPHRWKELYDAVLMEDPRKVQEESFGIAATEGNREITSENLKSLAILPGSKDLYLNKAREKFYEYVISGVDWGGSDYNANDGTKLSFTAHCIIGITSTFNIDILHMQKHSGQNYDVIISEIAEWHKKYGAQWAASDFGAGSVYNNMLREHINAEHHFVFSYSAPESKPMGIPTGPHLINQYSLNRNEAISNVYKLILADPQRLRTRDWAEVKDFMMDFMNMYRFLYELPSGKQTWRYKRAGNKSDDLLHAFNFAYTMGRLLKGEKLVDDAALIKRINNIRTGRSSFSDASALKSKMRQGGFGVMEV